MYFTHTALVAACVLILVKGQPDENDNPEKNNDDESEENDSENYTNGNHTFVALIDIVFKDNTKRTCTGAIVHDNVVVTAAHCFFGKDNSSKSRPELTASFVVVGTKNMFDTGYEQYLPIERIVVHPKYEGWTADLALVFTFAGMTSDKPGTIISIAGEKASAHMDSNVTTFSWGHTRKTTEESMEADKKKYEKYKKHTKVQPPASDEDSCDSNEESIHFKHTKKKSTTHRSLLFDLERQYQDEHAHQSKKKKSSRYKVRANNDDFEKDMIKGDEKRTSIVSRYLTLVESDEKIDSSINPYVFDVSGSYEIIKQKKNPHSTMTTRKMSSIPSVTNNYQTVPLWESSREEREQEPSNTRIEKTEESPLTFSLKSKKDWRRSMGSQQNRLLIENFSFVSLHNCRLLVDKALPPLYNISKHNDVLCYTNSDRCVDERDSGAPAVRQGKLVAITVGGAECEGDHIAVGMKMACYCSWISDNLPHGSTPLSCCKDCCDVKHKEVTQKERRHRFRNRYI